MSLSQSLSVMAKHFSSAINLSVENCRIVIIIYTFLSFTEGLAAVWEFWSRAGVIITFPAVLPWYPGALVPWSSVGIIECLLLFAAPRPRPGSSIVTFSGSTRLSSLGTSAPTMGNWIKIVTAGTRLAGLCYVKWFDSSYDNHILRVSYPATCSTFKPSQALLLRSISKRYHII